jgi:SAM-dependent methyltransferase
MADPTRRFSSRVGNYVTDRPAYPAAVVDLLTQQCGLTPDAQLADIGSGTGLLAELFLKNGNHVYAIEPNPEMRAAGERLLGRYPNFTSIDGSAEATTLGDRSVDFISAGQAFHWFDRARARAEFARILRPRGWVVLVWNERRTGSTPFLEAYERLLRSYSAEYETLNHRQIDQRVISSFFKPGSFSLRSYENRQIFDFTGLRGRLLSSSYTPEAGHPSYQPMLDELSAIFEAHQSGGTVAFEYDTNVYYGRL